MSTVKIDLPEAVFEAARRLAEEDKIPFEAFVALAVKDRIAALEECALLRQRAEKGRQVNIRELLAKVPKAPPMPGDEIQ